MVTGMKLLSLLTLTGICGSAAAQFGFVQIPRDDFVWTWGRTNALEARRQREDFSVVGGEGGFRCELTGKMSIARGSTFSEIRELEQQLQASLFFIRDSATLMYQMDQYRDIEWAMLDCKKPESSETESDLQEREDKARERAERRRERRRERDED
jgi:hypothetical protein